MARRPVQFDIGEEDNQDLDDLVGEIKSRTAVAKVLFLYGLTYSDDAFAWYAKRHAEARRKRLEEDGLEPKTPAGDG